MPVFPHQYTEFPNMNSDCPIHLAIHRLNRAARSHRHDYVEFSYVIAGEGEERINGRSHQMRPGTFTLILPHEVHEVIPYGTSPLQLYNGQFDLNVLIAGKLELDLLEVVLRSGADLAKHAHFLQDDHTQMLTLFERMHTEYDGGGRYRAAMMKSLLIEALILFERKRKPEVASEALAMADMPDRHSRKAWQLVQYIHRHYREPLSLQTLAADFELSPSYLSELFVKEVGTHYLAYLHDLRIRHACGLLQSTEMSVSEIALEVGYGSYTTFSRTFREQLSCTPREYRQHATNR